MKDWKVLSHNQIRRLKANIKRLSFISGQITNPDSNKNNTKKCVKKVRRLLEGIVFNWEQQDKKEKRADEPKVIQPTEVISVFGDF